jgi:hypothetical protein
MVRYHCCKISSDSNSPQPTNTPCPGYFERLLQSSSNQHALSRLFRATPTVLNQPTRPVPATTNSNKPITTIATRFLKPLNLLSYVQAAISLRLQPPKPMSTTSLLPLLLQKILILPFKIPKHRLLSRYSSLLQSLRFLLRPKNTTSNHIFQSKILSPNNFSYRHSTRNRLLPRFFTFHIDSYLDSSSHFVSREEAECSILVSPSTRNTVIGHFDLARSSTDQLYYAVKKVHCLFTVKVLIVILVYI